MPDVKPPTREVGSQRDWKPASKAMERWANLADDITDEHVPDLIWPLSVKTYRRMLDQDSQVQALAFGLTMPVRSQRRLVLDPGDMPERYAHALADDLNITIKGHEDHTTVGRRTGRVSMAKHRASALRALFVGHTIYELVAEIEDGIARLRRLAPRPQHTITRWPMDRHGDWTGVEQGWTFPATFIPRDRLLVYTWGEDGDENPLGRSLLRALYRHWIAKDKLYRIDLMAQQRFGMGIPVGEITDARGIAARDELLAIAANVGAGEDTGVVTPEGTRLRIEGASTGSGVLESAKYHDELMARALLSQVQMLGQTQTGSRALGEVHMDLLTMFHVAVADWEAQALTEQVVERWCQWNLPGDTGARVVAEPVDDATPSTDELGSMVGSGLVTMDAELERWVRSRSGLPEPDPVDPQAAVDGEVVDETATEGEDTEEFAGKEPRRPLDDRERRAGVNLRSLEQAHDSHEQTLRELLSELWRDLLERARQLLAREPDIREPGVLDRIVRQLLDAIPADWRTRAVLALRAATESGQQRVQDMASAQGAALATGASVDDGDLQAHADRLAETIARDAGGQLLAEAQRIAPPDSPGGETVALDARDAVEQRTTGDHRLIADQAAGGASESIGRGSEGMLRANEHLIEELWSMEILDTNTCPPCAEIDGTTYETLDDALRDYPTGKYVGCLGRNFCRGALGVLFHTQTEFAGFDRNQLRITGGEGGGRWTRMFTIFNDIDHAAAVLDPAVPHLTLAHHQIIHEWQKTDRTYEQLQMLHRSPDRLSDADLARFAPQDERLTEAIYASELPQSIRLYRGIRSLEKTFGLPLDQLVGHEDSWQGYLAGSVLRDVAASEFTAPPGALIEMNLPKGFSALWVAGVGDPSLKRQGEVLLPPDMRFRVTGSGFSADVPILYVEVIE